MNDIKIGQYVVVRGEHHPHRNFTIEVVQIDGEWILGKVKDAEVMTWAKQSEVWVSRYPKVR